MPGLKIVVMGLRLPSQLFIANHVTGLMFDGTRKEKNWLINKYRERY